MEHLVPSLTGQQVVVNVFVVAVAIWIFYCVRDPLRKVPGPTIARFSRLWLIVVDSSGQRTRTIHNLHKKHGSVVRVGPRELSFSTRQAMRDIYGPNNTLIKAPSYEAFGRQSSFTIRNKEAHRARQKRIAHVFSPAAISSVEPLVKEEVLKLLHLFENRLGQPIDIMEVFRIFALDVVGAVFLGKSFGGLENGKPPHIMRDLDDVFPSLWVEWQFAAIRPLLLAIPYKPLNHFLLAGPQFYKYGSDAFNDYVTRYGRSGSRRDLLTKLIAGSKDAEPLEDGQIVNEMTNLIFAGTDTTSNTFSYMFYELAKSPEWQKKLHAEIDASNFGHAGDDVPDYSEIMKLPILDAVVHETLRFHPAAPASLPRISIGKGRTSTVDGVPIPTNTIVSCQSYTVHRDPDIYPNPDSFDPGRWLTATEEHLNAMHDYILVWGKGHRACLGKPLAYMELKISTAAIMKKFRVEIGSSTTDDDMEMTDHFTLIPKGKRCILKLFRR